MLLPYYIKTIIKFILIFSRFGYIIEDLYTTLYFVFYINTTSFSNLAKVGPFIGDVYEREAFFVEP